jgi:NADH-quinone oxidoreductase subunit M
MTLLALLLLTPLFGALLVAMAGRVSASAARVTTTLFMAADLVFAYILLQQTPTAIRLDWIPSFGVHFALEADWLSALLVFLTCALGLAATAISWREIASRVTSFHVWLLVLQFGVMIVLLARDLMLFYLGWELMLLPVLFLIGGWGSGRKEYAAFKFVLFTFTGSIFMLASFLYVYWAYAQANGGTYTFELSELMKTPLSAREQWWVFLGLLIGFGVKIPLIPLHTWLLDAYPNAPTAGSLLLSGILSKTGVYGLYRFAMPFAPDVFADFRPVLLALAFVAIFYGAWCAFNQLDLKRLIAYSSLSHMGFIVLGLLLQNRAGFAGSVLQMINHGFTTAALFIVAGIVQQRLRTRDFDMLGGLWAKAPALGGFLLFFCLASLGIPGTGNFIGELFIVGGAFQQSWLLGSLAALGVFFGAAYSLRLFTAIMHGPTTALAADAHVESDARENLLLGALAAVLIIVGFSPRLITAPLNMTANPSIPHATALAVVQPTSAPVQVAAAGVTR